MLFSMRTRRATGIQDDLIEADTLEQAHAVAEAYVGKQMNTKVVYVKPAVVADKSILPADQQAPTKARVGK